MVVALAFADIYQTQQAEFPRECREADYESASRRNIYQWPVVASRADHFGHEKRINAL
jgi:S-adenosylmethionine:diacylglycerol 3-amino-3-carboxypropyl transferase